jgi:hypothetical protein
MRNEKFGSPDVSELTAYINEQTDLVADVIYGADLVSTGIEILPGQKGDFKLNSLTNDIYLQETACGWTTSGSTNYGQTKIELESISLKESFCAIDLEPYWMGQIMKPGSNPEELPFAKYIVDTKSAAISAEIDKMFWQGDKTNGTGNLLLVDGIGAFLSGATGDVYVAAASGTSTASTINTMITAMINSVDERAYKMNDLTLYMSNANYKNYVQYLISANLYNYATSIDGKSGQVIIPGHNIKVSSQSGLRGTTFMYLTPSSNLVMGTDLVSEQDQVDLWYDKSNLTHKFLVSFKMGVGVRQNDLLVHNNENLQ